MIEFLHCRRLQRLGEVFELLGHLFELLGHIPKIGEVCIDRELELNQ